MYQKIFAPLVPMYNYGVRLYKLNYPLTRLNIQRQSTVFQCVKAVNNLPQSIDLPMSAYKLKLEYKKHILRTYEVQQ